ncbi:MAG: MBOAT family protein [Chitinophagaceae bacterium]|nr:MBOAT family protein [Chitinophagaceae bacterium]
MLFNSFAFALFLPFIFLIHWYCCKKKIQQNSILLLASYFFYACWDWRFLFLLIFSTLLDYSSGLKIASTQQLRQKKLWLVLSVVINLGFLGVFKYYNFFIQEFAQGLAHIGVQFSPVTLEVIIPVGISFYTFHGLSYVFDVYNNTIKPEKNIVDYGLFVSFFPLLVAGPIERATHLLPQFKAERNFDYSNAVNGLRQILWGLFKKIVIADQCAQYVNIIFENTASHSGSTLLVGAFLFAIQIYCDFSGYSDIAIGTAKLFGITLLKNFSFPYFSRNMAEFWRRWHISLSSWFKDYMYIPLGGSRKNLSITIRNVCIIFLVCGFWHGANWTFIFWGFLNALLVIPSVIHNTNRNYLNIVASVKILPSLKETFQILVTFFLTILCWIFFRAENLTQAIEIVVSIFSTSIFTWPSLFPKLLMLLIVFLMFIEWMGRERNYALEKMFIKKSIIVRRLFYYSIVIVILFFVTNEQQEFIYFQF